MSDISQAARAAVQTVDINDSDFSKRTFSACPPPEALDNIANILLDNRQYRSFASLTFGSDRLQVPLNVIARKFVVVNSSGESLDVLASKSWAKHIR